MVAAGLSFAMINVLTQWVGRHGYPSPALAFWQYALALIFFVPAMFRLGIGAFRTRRPLQHLLRVVFAALGVQFFVAALAHGVPVGQVVAIDMTSPFMVIVGAWLYLGERIGPARLIATVAGFVGGIIILAPWDSGFTPYSLLPLGAAAMWAGWSLMTKHFVGYEKPEAVTVHLLVLLMPINALILAMSGGFSVAAFALPHGDILIAVLALAALTAAAQGLLTRAYASADAAYLQAFDNVRLPINVFAGWLVFASVPGGHLWLGAVLVVGASLFLLKTEAGGDEAKAAPPNA